MVVGKGMLEESRFGFFGRKKMECEREKIPLDKVLEDFPWLWAVKSCWASRYDVPRVLQEMFDIEIFLGVYTSCTTSFKLWIALAEDGRVWHVMPIEAKGENTCWAQEILRELKCGNPLYVIMGLGKELRVYRHPRGSRGLEKLIEDIALRFRATHPDAPYVGRDLSGALL